MNAVGKLSKMSVVLEEPIQYFFCTNEEKTHLNPYIGKQIRLYFTGKINCVACDRPIKKSYQQGYCFVCTQKLAQCDLCVLKPERCHYHQGTCREPEWGDTHCMIGHYVYLSKTSGLKVGITRKSQVPTRWIDQGATQAITLFEVATRQVSGFVEVKLAEGMSDKTNWRNMLKGICDEINLIEQRDKLLSNYEQLFAQEIERFGPDSIKPLANANLVQIDYPVHEYPKKITSLSFDKTPEIKAILMGIKGQYLIFDTGVINIRKFGGYEVGIEVG